MRVYGRDGAGLRSYLDRKLDQNKKQSKLLSIAAHMDRKLDQIQKRSNLRSSTPRQKAVSKLHHVFFGDRSQHHAEHADDHLSGSGRILIRGNKCNLAVGI